MSRRRSVRKLQITLDPRYKNYVVSKLINYIMECGKKSVAEKIVYDAISDFSAQAKLPDLECVNQAINNLKPSMEVRSRRIGGATYQVPVDVRDTRQLALALRNLIMAANKRTEKTMKDKLAGELFDAFNSRGIAFKKKEDTHKMAESNKAFAHYKIN